MSALQPGARKAGHRSVTWKEGEAEFRLKTSEEQGSGGRQCYGFFKAAVCFFRMLLRHT